VVFASVAVPRIGPDTLTYSVPEEYQPLVAAGSRVRVSVRNRATTGIVVDLEQTTSLDTAVIRPIEELLDVESPLPDSLLDLARFVAAYYRCPLGTTLAAMLPAPLLRADSEEVELTPAGATADLGELSNHRASLLEELRKVQRTRVATLLARAGTRSRKPLEALEHAGLVKLRTRRRDRAPRTEVAAVRLADTPVDELLESCKRAPRQREVIEWLAEQQRPALLSEVLAAVGCSGSTVRALVERGALVRFTQRPPQRPRWSLPGSGHRHVLTDEQRSAVEAVESVIRTGEFAPFLLHGITGSGKTEVYLRCLETALAAGRSGLVLVPEIGLTPAASGAVERRFGAATAVLHSAMSEGERWREWQRVKEGSARIVVGPRSALFSPLQDLGLIVIDEEHDGAYKQQEAPRYHARDLALLLGQRQRVPVLLCSATPSVETAALVLRDMAAPLALTRRVSGGELPEVEVIDLRGEPPDEGEQGRTLYSRRLRGAIEETLAAGDQAILLMQRRGWAPVLMCRECGTRIECPSCSVSLVVHRRDRDLNCHYCGHRAPLPSRCPSCAGELLDAVGAGTEKAEHHLRRLFPDIAVALLDRDTARRRDGLHDTLGAFASGKTQVLLGTQLVAKGHHFPNVTLTGVISADAMLGLPDFRAGERTFQLLTQLAGRAGRGSKPGRVIIQTYYPQHPAVRYAQNHAVKSFLDEELVYRRAFAYPPAARMAVVRWESKNATRVRQAAEEGARLGSPTISGVRLRGPAPAPIERIRGQWRWQILISAQNRELLRDVLDRIEEKPTAKDVRRIVDVDPYSTL
jgi:primosomal protein N' (replication factor Y)